MRKSSIHEKYPLYYHKILKLLTSLIRINKQKHIKQTKKDNFIQFKIVFLI